MVQAHTSVTVIRRSTKGCRSPLPVAPDSAVFAVISYASETDIPIMWKYFY
jgi:hypothetical protein